MNRTVRHSQLELNICPSPRDLYRPNSSRCGIVKGSSVDDLGGAGHIARSRGCRCRHWRSRKGTDSIWSDVGALLRQPRCGSAALTARGSRNQRDLPSTPPTGVPPQLVHGFAVDPRKRRPTRASGKTPAQVGVLRPVAKCRGTLAVGGAVERDAVRPRGNT